MLELKTNPVLDMANRTKRLLLAVDSDTNNLIYTSTLLKRFDYPTDTARVSS